MNELAKRAMDSIKELRSTGFVKVTISDYNQLAENKEDRNKSTVHKSGRGECLVFLNIVTADDWDNIAHCIAMAYKLADEVRDIYLYRAANPIPQEALQTIFHHECSKH